MTPDEQLREQVRFHMRAINTLEQQMAAHQTAIEAIQQKLWELAEPFPVYPDEKLDE